VHRDVERTYFIGGNVPDDELPARRAQLHRVLFVYGMLNRGVGTVRVFRQGFTLRGCHWFPRMLAGSDHACDQRHSSRVSIPLTGWHRLAPVGTVILHPNTEGHGQPARVAFVILTMNSGHYTDAVTHH
jgi:hypothetical protein